MMMNENGWLKDMRNPHRTRLFALGNILILLWGIVTRVSVIAEAPNIGDNNRRRNYEIGKLVQYVIGILWEVYRIWQIRND